MDGSGAVEGLVRPLNVAVTSITIVAVFESIGVFTRSVMAGLALQSVIVALLAAAVSVDGLSLDVAAGSLVILMGPSGCGKTTLLSCLGGILRPTDGAIKFGDVDVTALNAKELAVYRQKTVGIVFQAFNLVPSLTALENVMMPLRMSGLSRRASRKRAGQLLARIGLDPPLLLADEPTGETGS